MIVIFSVTSDDCCNAQLQFDGGFCGVLTVSAVAISKNTFKFSVSGSKGTLTIDQANLFFSHFDESGRNVVVDNVLEDPIEKDSNGMKIFFLY